VSDLAPDPIPATEEPPSLPSFSGEGSVGNALQRVFGTPSFFRLWLAQMVSGLGDWIGIVAILSIASRVSTSASAVGLVMTARMVPGFVLAPLAGALVDRWNRKTVMVASDLARAALLGLLPFWDTLGGLVVLAFWIEILALVSGTAKQATVPNVVASKDQLASANSLGLVAGFGTFPLGALIFAALAGVATRIGDFDALSRFSVNQEALAIWLNSWTLVAAAVLISGLHLSTSEHRVHGVHWTEPFVDMVDGLRFIRSHALVRGVMIGIAGGLLGGGVIVPLGPVFARDVLGEGAGGFGLLMTALGVGAAVGVVTLLALQKRLPLARVFDAAVLLCGATIIVCAAMSSLTFAMLSVGVVGATAGTAYVAGITMLQENVHDELRGRTFGTLYTVVRLALILSLTIGPFVTSLLDRVSKTAFDDQVVTVGSVSMSLPGVRLTLALGGAMTILAGMLARRRMRMAHVLEPADAGGAA
jgi:dTMP kinase